MEEISRESRPEYSGPGAIYSKEIAWLKLTKLKPAVPDINQDSFFSRAKGADESQRPLSRDTNFEDFA